MTPTVVAIIPSEDVLQTLALADRRVTLHRVLFDLYAATFPARVPQLLVSVIFCGGVGQYQAGLRCVSPSGTEVATLDFAFEAKTYHLQSVNLAGMELPEAGEYRLQVMLENRPVASAPLVVAQLTQTP
jgi:hypothetical protein